MATIITDHLNRRLDREARERAEAKRLADGPPQPRSPQRARTLWELTGVGTPPAGWTAPERPGAVVVGGATWDGDGFDRLLAVLGVEVRPEPRRTARGRRSYNAGRKSAYAEMRAQGACTGCAKSGSWRPGCACRA